MVAAPQASAKERKQMQDTENLPLLLTVASEKLKQMNEVVQTQGENPLTLVTASQKYKKRKEHLKKNEIQHGLLSLESEEFQRVGKGTQNNIKIQTATVVAEPKSCDTAREAPHDSEAQSKEAYDSSYCESENVVLSGKDFREHNSEEVESRTDKLQKVSIYGTYIWHTNILQSLFAAFILKNITTPDENYILFW